MKGPGRLGERRKFAKDGRMKQWGGRGGERGENKYSLLSLSICLVHHNQEEVLVDQPFLLKQCLHHYFMREHHRDL